LIEVIEVLLFFVLLAIATCLESVDTLHYTIADEEPSDEIEWGRGKDGGLEECYASHDKQQEGHNPESKSDSTMLAGTTEGDKLLYGTDDEESGDDINKKLYESLGHEDKDKS